MTRITFAVEPRVRRIVRDQSLLELMRAADDTSGRTWPAGTQLQPSSHGNAGYTYTVVRVAEVQP